jgi:hypothetical protein
MILRRFQNAPEKLMPVAMTFIAVGLSILTIGIAWPRFSPSVPHLGTDWNDFFRGFMYGLAITLEAAGVVFAVSAARAGSKRRKTL